MLENWKKREKNWIKPAIVIHGGAINPLNEEFNRGVSQASVEAMSILENGGKSLDAVVRSLEVMENNPIFNAGTGSWPNFNGEIEMDAIIMEGKIRRSGAVGCIQMVKNPILVARKVMEETDHILLVGNGAERFARNAGFRNYNPITESRRVEWQEMVGKLKHGENVPLFEYWKKLKKYASDTVGAVAIDVNDNIAAGTSSGGFPLKLPGRIGDVPLIGCSTYAQNLVGGVSITGHGEVVMKNLIAKSVCDELAKGSQVQPLVEETVRKISRTEKGEILLTVIAMDQHGNIGVARNAELTPHAYFRKGMKKPEVSFAPIIK